MTPIVVSDHFRQRLIQRYPHVKRKHDPLRFEKVIFNLSHRIGMVRLDLSGRKKGHQFFYSKFQLIRSSGSVRVYRILSVVDERTNRFVTSVPITEYKRLLNQNLATLKGDL